MRDDDVAITTVVCGECGWTGTVSRLGASFVLEAHRIAACPGPRQTDDLPDDQDRLEAEVQATIAEAQRGQEQVDALLARGDALLAKARNLRQRLNQSLSE